MVANIGMRSHGGDNFVGKVFGIAGGEAHSHFGGGFSHDSQQCSHIHGGATIGRLVEVAVHILPQQNHLLKALALQIAQLIEDALRLTATFTPSRVGHDAIGAEIVAAPHNADVAAHLIATDAVWNDVAVGFGGGEGGVDSLFAGFGSGGEVGQFEIGIRTCHNIHIIIIDEHLLQSLRHTADNAHNQAARPAPTQRIDLVEPRKNFLLGIIANGACVDKNGIGIVDAFGGVVARHFHHRSHHLAIRHIHLAAIGFDKK